MNRSHSEYTHTWGGSAVHPIPLKLEIKEGHGRDGQTLQLTPPNQLSHLQGIRFTIPLALTIVKSIRLANTVLCTALSEQM